MTRTTAEQFRAMAKCHQWTMVAAALRQAAETEEALADLCNMDESVVRLFGILNRRGLWRGPEPEAKEDA